MNTAVVKVMKVALELTNDEREELVDVLAQSLAPVELDPAWKAEIARRIAKIESGEAVLHDAMEHARQLRAKFE